MSEPAAGSDAAGEATPERSAPPWLRRLGPGGIVAAVIGALFVIGLIGWLAQGAGTGDPVVPTVPEGGPTTLLTADDERVDSGTASNDAVDGATPAPQGPSTEGPSSGSPTLFGTTPPTTAAIGDAG